MGSRSLALVKPPNEQWSYRGFLAYMKGHWKPGEHVGIAGKTGAGKTWIGADLVPMRRWAVVLATKQQDETIERFKDFRKVQSWKDRHYSERHVVVWPYAKTLAEAKSIKRKEAEYLLNAIFIERGWTLYIDDLDYVCRGLGLKTDMAVMLTQCRSQGTSILVNYQRPFNIIQEALDQTSYSLMFYQKDKRDVYRLAEANGESPEQCLRLNSQLRLYDFLLFRPMAEPVIVRR